MMHGMDVNVISGAVIDSSICVHTALGPGLLEGVYQACLVHELRERGFHVVTNVDLPVNYKGISLPVGYRMDLLVNDLVVVELKAVERVHPIHQAQLMTYLKVGRRKLGLLINFNVVHLKQGITRIVNGL